MSRYIIFIVVAAVATGSSGAFAQDAREIMEIARQKQLERWEGIDAYVVDQAIMGQTSSTWYVRTDLQQPDGSTGTVFLPMAAAQMQGGQCGIGQMSDEDLATFAAAAEATGDATATEIEDGLEAAGLPRGMLAATGSDPWNTMDPRVMMGGYADFLTAAAHAQREADAYDPDRDAEAQLNDMNRFMETAKLVGTETVDGRNANHLRATGLDLVERAEDGQEYRIDSMSVYIDAQEYVPLRMRVEGTMVSADGSQDMIIEIQETDYRQVPGSNLYESYRRIMKMSGMLTPAQEAEMAEAQAQMADFEKQLASMPESQRQMMEQMMGPQLEMMRNMASGGGFQTEVTTTDIRVNPPMRDASGQVCPGSDAPAQVGAATVASSPPAPVLVAQSSPSASDTGDGVTMMIQEHLTTLGYDTGNTSGDLSTETIVAISQFQAENNMAVTGEPSPQLAGILAARVSAANTSPQRTPAELQAAQQACLQKKMEESQAAQKKKRGFGRLLSGVGRLAGQSGNFDLAEQTNDIYQAGATAEDFSQAAKDLGLTEDEVAACQNPL